MLLVQFEDSSPCENKKALEELCLQVSWTSPNFPELSSCCIALFAFVKSLCENALRSTVNYFKYTNLSNLYTYIIKYMIKPNIKALKMMGLSIYDLISIISITSSNELHRDLIRYIKSIYNQFLLSKCLHF